MPYVMFVIDDFWYDTEYARLDRYHGSELNLYPPREAEGMTLNTIGGDNYDTELPVGSMVIPDNYTNIAFGAFANCETLETIICYAPLETVYVGPYVETIGESSGFSSYITDPALMPDVETLLTTVKSDPMGEPTPAPAAAPADPVCEEGAAFVGTWKAVSMEMEGEAFAMADLGVEITLSLNADGTAENYDGETTSTDTWSVENGAVVMTDMLMTMDAEGRLVMEMDGMKLFFEKNGAAPAADASAFLGTWTADTLRFHDAASGSGRVNVILEKHNLKRGWGVSALHPRFSVSIIRCSGRGTAGASCPDGC